MRLSGTEPPKCPGPAARHPAPAPVIDGAMGVAEAIEDLGLVEAVLLIPEKAQGILITARGFGVVAKLALGIAEAVRGMFFATAHAL
jgi:hypothetical protein